MILAASEANPLWFVSRGVGAATLLALTASLAVGIIAGSGARSSGWPRFASAGLHRNLSITAMGLLVVHVATAVLDPYARIAWRDAVQPMASVYRPFWVGLGAVALDILAVLAVTSALRRRLGYRAWRAVHWTGYACWPPALLHALGTGSDVHTAWLAGTGAMCLVLIAGLAAWRVWTPKVGPGTRATVHAAIVVAVVGTIAFTALGPLRPGWARLSGTPAAMLASTHKTPPPAPDPTTSSVDPATGAHLLAVTITPAAGGGSTILATDMADPAVQLVLRPPRADEAGPILAVVHEGQLGCVSTATISDVVTARCGATLVQLRLETTGPVTRGWLTVSPAPTR